MSYGGRPEFIYHIFDYVPEALNCKIVPPYHDRARIMTDLDIPRDGFHRVYPVTMSNQEELDKYESECVSAGYEGICYRTPESGYKFGRSTGNQQWLVKVKQFVTEEAVVIGMERRYHNANEATTSELGYQVRSSHQANMVPLEEMGSLILYGGFKVGTGFTAQERVEFWQRQSEIIGQVCQYRYQRHGMKDQPRIPAFVGFRSRDDMSPGDIARAKSIEQFELPYESKSNNGPTEVGQ